MSELWVDAIARVLLGISGQRAVVERLKAYAEKNVSSFAIAGPQDWKNNRCYCFGKVSLVKNIVQIC